MSRQLSIERVLADLQGRIDHHRTKQAFHEAQEAFHQAEKARHAADLQIVLERFETFKAAADAVDELVASPLKEEKAALDDSIPAGKSAVLSKLIARLVAAKPAGQTFGATEITREAQQRYGSRLKRPVDVRTVGAKLRRMAQAGQIHQVSEGRAFHEALYSRTGGGGG